MYFIIPIYIYLSYRVFWPHLSKIHLTYNMTACYSLTIIFFDCQPLSRNRMFALFSLHSRPAAALATLPPVSLCPDTKRVATTRCPRHSFSTGSAALPPL